MSCVYIVLHLFCFVCIVNVPNYFCREGPMQALPFVTWLKLIIKIKINSYTKTVNKQAETGL